MNKKNIRLGASSDAILLIAVKLVTAVLGIAITRLLSEYLSVYDYGTYSQILLIVSTVSSLTIFGMMDGVNFFYCSKQDEQERESYVVTMFALQCMVSTAAGLVVMLLCSPLCAYFENPDIRKVLIFAAALPMLQNIIYMLQVLLISVGKASVLALRNLVVSIVRLLVAAFVIIHVRSVLVVLLTTLLLDFGQIGLFCWILKKSGCVLRMRNTRLALSKTIIHYCAPMAVFVVLNSLNRDIDKYLVAMWTDTETLALYSNASKVLPFDIVISSFTTVLLPQLTRAIVEKRHERATMLYRSFLEIAYISTTILCCAALASSPQLMKLLYSNKYLSGLNVFCIYILVDLLRFTNITMILTAAGKTKKLMLLSVGSLLVNVVLNVVLFHILGITGPAIATLATTLLLGVAILSFGARELKTTLTELFDWKFLLRFVAENLVLALLMYRLQMWLEVKDVHYFLVLVIICGSYGLIMLALHGKRLLKAISSINKNTLH